MKEAGPLVGEVVAVNAVIGDQLLQRASARFAQQ